MQERKKYVILHKNKTPFSQVVNDCETSLCVPVTKGENLNSVIKKLCKLIALQQAGSNSTRLFNKSLIGDKDGYNAVFTTSSQFVLESTAVYLNGQRMKLSFDYHETNNQTITFTFPIEPTDQLIIDYNKL